MKLKDDVVLQLLAFILVFQQTVAAFGSYNDRVHLKDVEVLTLYNGKQTQARRSSSIPQLRCVGGTAGCSSFVPKVVQCYNRGSDGYDVQWECKTDMDNAYRFGQVEVSCEGYEHPDDPYVLRGSCGLEYTLDYTKEGYQQNKQHDYYGNQQHGYYGNQHHDSGYSNDYHYRSNNQGYGSRAKSVVGDVIFLCIVGGVIYAIYRTCIASSSHQNDGSDDSYRRHGNYGGHSQGPPPPGFRPDTYPDDCGSTYNSGYSTYNHGYQRNAGSGWNGGGFWSGAATGGILGYMFGNRNSGYYGSRTHAYPGSSWGHSYSSPGSSFFGGSSGSRSFSSGSSGTRTASGFGGTKRR